MSHPSNIDTQDLPTPYDPDLLLGLSEEQIEAAYRHQLLKYTAMDVKHRPRARKRVDSQDARPQLKYCFDLDNDELAVFSDTELLLLLIADRFLNGCDCNTDDNTAWYSLLRDELTRLLEELQEDDSCERPYELVLAIVEALDKF